MLFIKYINRRLYTFPQGEGQILISLFGVNIYRETSFYLTWVFLFEISFNSADECDLIQRSSYCEYLYDCVTAGIIKTSNPASARIRAGLVIACWLLLNLQLTVAAHHGGQQQPVAPQVQIHHIVDGVMSMPGMESVGQKAICEKHCDPDTAQPNSLTSLQLNALPSETALLVVSPQQETCAERMDWRTPPVTGPPAEIRFCRFRE